MEKILYAAIYKPGDIDMAGNRLIYCSHRHCNILWQGDFVSRNPHHHEFLTSTGRFVNRKEAMKIAIGANQILDLSETRGDQLFSEDLY